MSTRMTQFGGDILREPSGYEGTDAPDDFTLPSCTLEDTDRSVFDLFNGQLPLQYNQNGETKRIPVIFSTGERFAVLSRREPLRDKNKTLILPLISIMRTGINQTPDNGHGPGQMQPTKLKIKISPESDTYKRLLNKLGIDNQDGVASVSHEIGGLGGGTEPGTVGSRRRQNRGESAVTNDISLKPDVLDNVYEIITMPPVKHYQATYNITIWAQFMNQMNEIMSAVMSMYQNNYGRTFRLETPKGYWFVGYVGNEFSSDNNYDDFTDSERLIKQSFDIRVNSYLVLPEYPGSPNGLRRKISAPKVEFKIEGINSAPVESLNANVPSPHPAAYVLDSLSREGDGLPGQAIAASSVASSMSRIGEKAIGASVIDDESLSSGTPVVGNYAGNSSDMLFYRFEVDPFTGKRKKIIVSAVKQRLGGVAEGRKGETVYREGLVSDLDDI